MSGTNGDNFKFRLLVGALLHLHNEQKAKGENCTDLEVALAGALLINDEKFPERMEQGMRQISDIFLGEEKQTPEDETTH